MIEGKRAEVVALKSLAEELKQGVPEIDKDYLNEQLADLDNTVAVLAKSCVKHQQELEEGLKRSNNFYDKLQKAIASVNEKKEELAKISQANLDTPSVKAKLDELNVRPPLTVYFVNLFYLMPRHSRYHLRQWALKYQR